MNYIIDLGFSDLPFGPIWETGLWIPLPASIAIFRTMVTFLWDRRCDAFELFLIDSCELHKHSDDGQYTCNQKTDHLLGQSMATEQKVQHVDGRDVALDLNPLLRTVVHQVYPESSSYGFYVVGYPRRFLSSCRTYGRQSLTSYKVLGMGVVGVQEGSGADYGSPRKPWTWLGATDRP